MRPTLSYTIWFSQRNGSTLLCKGLESTGIAGRPQELFHIPDGSSLLAHYGTSDYTELQQKLWQAGSTANGVFGLKTNAPLKKKDPIITCLAKIPGLNKPNPNALEIWEHAFPNHKHIFLMRRNKVRQAISWWKAIVTSEWHRESGTNRPYKQEAIQDQYNFDAIKHLLIETTLREAKIQSFLDHEARVPMTVVYEDFILDYEQTIQNIISYIGIKDTKYPINPPYFDMLADEVSDEWEDRFRMEMQKDWPRQVW